jgi:hypothetical protein
VEEEVAARLQVEEEVAARLQVEEEVAARLLWVGAPAVLVSLEALR